MADQYHELVISGPTTIELTDGTDTFRIYVAGTELYYAQAITELGFSGEQGTDWDIIDSESLPGTKRGWFRLGARDDNYVTDQAITITGFGGTKGTDWENVSERNVA